MTGPYLVSWSLFSLPFNLGMKIAETSCVPASLWSDADLAVPIIEIQILEYPEYHKVRVLYLEGEVS